MSLWYKRWKDFEIPPEEDVPDLQHAADMGVQVIKEGGTVLISCLSGRGRSGTFAALLLGRLQGISTHSQLVDAIVQMRNHRDGLLEMPQQYRFVARSLGLSDPAVCDVLCILRQKDPLALGVIIVVLLAVVLLVLRRFLMRKNI
jgi:hypothetical protein